jgi:hypothetical protein
MRERFVAQPHVVLAGPGTAAVVDDPVPQQQFRQPMPGSHQIAAAVLAGADQVAGGFLVNGGDRHRADLIQPQQPGEVDCVLGVGLHPVTGGPLQLARRRHRVPDPRRGQRPVQAEPVGPASYVTATGPGSP